MAEEEVGTVEFMVSDSPVDDKSAALPSTAEPAVEGEKPVSLPADGEDTAAAPDAPNVESLQAELTRLRQERERLVSGYDRLKGDARQKEAALRRYQERESAELKKIMADKDLWAETVLDPEKYGQFLERQQALTESMIDQKLAERDSVMQQVQTNAEAADAFADLQTFAFAQAKLTPDKFRDFLDRHSVQMPDGSKVPFGGYPPKEALRIAKALLRDENFDAFANKTREAAEKDADQKAKRKLQSALPKGVDAGGGASGPKSPDQEYREGVRESGGVDPRRWFNAA